MPTGLRSFLVFLILVFLGPLIGGVFVAIFSQIAGPVAMSLDGFLGFLFFTVLFSYVLGGVPALLSASWIAKTIIDKRPIGYIGALFVGIIASVVFVFFFALFSLIKTSPIPQEPFQLRRSLALFGTIVLPGAFSALICRWLLAVTGIMPLSVPSSSPPSSKS